MRTRENHRRTWSLHVMGLVLLTALGMIGAPALGGLSASNPATYDHQPVGPEEPDALIQPGDPLTRANGVKVCTLNFVFEGTGHLAGKMYIGTAGHCVDADGSDPGHEPDPGANPSEVIWSTPGFTDFATVVYDNDIGDGDEIDFALLEIGPAFHHAISPEVEGHPLTPTGAAGPGDTFVGDLLSFSGYGMGYDLTETTREDRIGFLVEHTACQYTAEARVHWGDSGGPVLHRSSGLALGVVSRLNGPFGSEAVFPPTWLIGSTVECIIASLDAHGLPVQLVEA